MFGLNAQTRSAVASTIAMQKAYVGSLAVRKIAGSLRASGSSPTHSRLWLRRPASSSESRKVIVLSPLVARKSYGFGGGLSSCGLLAAALLLRAGHKERFLEGLRPSKPSSQLGNGGSNKLWRTYVLRLSNLEPLC